MDSVRATPKGGLPHSDIRGSKGARPSPRLFAACHVLLRLLVPRHPLNALLTLTISSLSPCAGRSRLTEICTHHARLKHSPPRLPRTVRPRRSPGGTLHQTLFTCQRTLLRPIPRTAPQRGPDPARSTKLFRTRGGVFACPQAPGAASGRLARRTGGGRLRRLGPLARAAVFACPQAPGAASGRLARRTGGGRLRRLGPLARAAFRQAGAVFDKSPTRPKATVFDKSHPRQTRPGGGGRT